MYAYNLYQVYNQLNFKQQSLHRAIDHRVDQLRAERLQGGAELHQRAGGGTGGRGRRGLARAPVDRLGGQLARRLGLVGQRLERDPAALLRVHLDVVGVGAGAGDDAVFTIQSLTCVNVGSLFPGTT